MIKHFFHFGGGGLFLCCRANIPFFFFFCFFFCAQVGSLMCPLCAIVIRLCVVLLLVIGTLSLSLQVSKKATLDNMWMMISWFV